MFQVGDKVFDTQFGDGEVVAILEDSIYPIVVEYIDPYSLHPFHNEYTSKGLRHPKSKYQSLYHIGTKTISIAKPEKCSFNAGDLVLVRDGKKEVAGTRHEVEIFRKDLVLDGVLAKIASGDYRAYRTILGKALENSIDDVKADNIVMDYRNDHIVFKDVLHVRLDDGREMPLFEADGMNLWAEVK